MLGGKPCSYIGKSERIVGGNGRSLEGGIEGAGILAQDGCG